MKTYKIYLIRHGITEGGGNGRYIGRLDNPLSAEGERQLYGYREKYGYPLADVYFSSPKQRCVRSMEILYPNAQPHILQGLAECDFGIYEGRTFAELKSDPQFMDWATGKSDAAPKGGESSREFQQRTLEAFDGIVDMLLRGGGSSAAVMAHGGSIMTILGSYGYPRRNFIEWMVEPGRGYELMITPKLWLDGKVIEAMGMIPYEIEQANEPEARE